MGKSASYEIISKKNFIRSKKIYQEETENDLKIYQNFSLKHYRFEQDYTNHIIGSIKVNTGSKTKGI